MITRKNEISAIVVFSVCFWLLCPSFMLLGSAQNTRSSNNGTIEVNVGVILDMDTDFGKMGLSCIKMALSDFYASNSDYKTRLVLHTRDSKSDVVGAAAAALDLIKNIQVQAILGPETSMQTHFVIDLGDKAQVPIITFSAKSPSLTSLRSPFFFRIATNDSSQVEAIGAIVKAFGWREVVPIYVDNEYSEGIIPYLTDSLQTIDARVPYRSVIPPSATDDQIAVELNNLMTMQTRVFILHMLPDLGARIFAMAERIGMMGSDHVWIMTDGVTDFLCSANTTILYSMQGALGVKTHVPKTNELRSFKVRWRTQFQRENPSILNPPLVVVGLWAYDAVWGLAKAVEETGKTTRFGFKKMNISGYNSTDLNSLRVSQSGLELVQALSKTRFKGLSGEFRLINWQLQTSSFEIVNVNGSGERSVGFWTPENGLVRMLASGSGDGTKYSTLNTSLGPIIWPGNSTFAPKGWQIPAKGKKLRIGVPVKYGFKEFVNVSFPFSNDTVIGYSIDVFKAVLEELPYFVPYEFFPYSKDGGKTAAGTYNDFTYQVFAEKFDAVIGDLTIRANRSLYVDFTLPYTESGVSMVVPIRNDKSKNAWVFLKPLTWDLWVASGCFFIFVGFVIWVLEHRINDDFRGPPHHQVGTSFWYSFLTIVFAHRERVVSNLARFVVIIWCFVVLILTQSYTASLTSRLTVQQLQPTITDVNQLLKNKENVGFQKGSFVEGILLQLGFKVQQFRIYNNPEELYKLFTNGNKNGGIAAAFDETPHMKLFLARYCSKFTMIEPTFKANGFAFAFPKGSPLVPDISRAILKVTEGKKMKDIEAVWFKKETSCPDPTNKFSSNSLGLESFWGLFLVAGVASFLALAIFGGIFFYEQRHILMNSTADSSLWRRIVATFRTFDEKDLSSHTFRKNEAGERSNMSLPNTNCPPSPSGSPHTIFTQSPSRSPNTNFAPSPLGFSLRMNSSFVFREQETTSPDPNGAQPSDDQEIVDQSADSSVELTFQTQELR